MTALTRYLMVAASAALMAMPAPLSAQKVFTFFYEHSSQYAPNETALPASVKAVLDTVRAHLVKVPGMQEVPSFTDARTFEYQTPCAIITETAIVQSSPAKFLSCQAELRRQKRDTLVPILIVRKYGLARPYYSALILARADAPLQEVSDDALGKIKTFYLADSTSTSGYVAPLHMLWTSGLIAAPTLPAALKKLGKHLSLPTEADPFSVKAKLKKDSLAIGAVGEYGTPQAEDSSLRADKLKVLLRYDLIPQGVVAITRNLVPAGDSIAATLLSVFRTVGPANPPSFGLADTNARIIAGSQVGITGLLPYTREYANAYAGLARTIALVHGELRVGAVEGPAGLVSISRYALQAAILIVVFCVGLFTAGALRHRQELIVYLFFAVLGATWFMIFLQPKLLSSPALFLFIMLSAALGTTARVILRVLAKGTNLNHEGPTPSPAFTEAIMGLALAFGFTIVFFVTESTTHRDFQLPPAEVDVQRMAIAVALLSFGSALLLEDASAILQKFLLGRLGSGGGEKHAAAPAGETKG